MRMERTEPILPSRDLDETRAFYQQLGFVAWFGKGAPWTYEILSRGQLVVHFRPDGDLRQAECLRAVRGLLEHCKCSSLWYRLYGTSEDMRTNEPKA